MNSYLSLSAKLQISRSIIITPRIIKCLPRSNYSRGKTPQKQAISRLLSITFIFEYSIWHPSVLSLLNVKRDDVKSSTGTKWAVINSQSINNEDDSIVFISGIDRDMVQ